jgi:hypothetical protein
MENQLIEALGFLLSWYRKDLKFFLAFQKFDVGGRNIEAYCTDERGSFQDFINAYQVTRTLKKGETQALLETCLEWHDTKRWIDVSGLASEIEKRELVHGFPLSLASKVMFLMCPEEILPFDRRAKNTLGMKESRPLYADYYHRALSFGKENNISINKTLAKYSDLLEALEREYQDLKVSFEALRRMRLLDKLLWTGTGGIVS